jgi:glycosyltransferase involved in cell wall biosynthesis
MPSLTVAICTHNPRADYLSRTLEGLKAQSLPRTEWDFVIIDNASSPALAGQVDLSWHPHARVVVENELGIVHARMRAMREFTGPLLVFLDDDNVLAPDYLAKCLELFAERPDLGAVSGCLMPEYEAKPPAWFEGSPYESWIAVRRIEQSAWSNFLDSRSEPVTAGMCLRRDVAEAHVQRAVNNPLQGALGSKGTSLLRGEDVAIVKTAVRMGYTIGQFADLKALHLIAARRCTPGYLFALFRHLCASGYLLSWADALGREPVRLSWRAGLRLILHLVKGDQIRRRLAIEEIRGFNLARKIAQEWAGRSTEAKAIMQESKSNA